MELNNFEKHLKTSLHDVEEEVDVGQLMAAISPIKTRKNKKGLYIASILLVAVIMVGGLGYYGGLDISSSENLSELTQKHSTFIESNHPSLTTNSSTAIDPSSIDQENQEIGTQSTNITTNSRQLKTTYQNKTLATKKYNNISDKAVISTQNNRSELVELGNSESSLAGLQQEQFVNKNKQGYNNNSLKNVSTSTNDKILASTSKLKSMGFKNLEENVDFNADLLMPKQVDCPTFAENPWIFDFGTVMGLSNPSKTLTKKTTDILPAYASRATNEKSLEGLDLELYISAKRTRWPVFLKTGLNYSRWSERMRIEEDYTEIDTIQGIISITTSQEGDTVKYIYGDVYVERDVQIRKSIHYYINRLDIPLSVVYEKEYGNHAFQAELGTRVNFSTFARGLIYNEKEDFSLASAPSTFRKLTGLNYFGKLHYRYYVSNHSYLGAQAYYQYIPADLSGQSNRISQKYTNYGLGIYYGFRF